jgi:hypothetical protein
MVAGKNLQARGMEEDVTPIIRDNVKWSSGACEGSFQGSIRTPFLQTNSM